MIDRYNYVSPSRVKMLLVPVRSLKSSKFTRYVDTLQQARNEVKLSELTPMTELKYFNPQTFPNGQVMLDLTTSAPDSESIFLHDFEPCRKTFIVLGIGSYNDADTDQDKDNCIQNLRVKYPGTIVQNIIFFDTPQDKIEQLNRVNDHSRRTIFYHGFQKGQGSYCLESTICNIANNFLFELDNYALSYSNITLRSPVSITNSNMISKTISQAQKRLSMGSSSFKVSFSNNGSSPNSSIDSKSKAQRFTGRKNKLLGNFYLLAGKYLDALNLFTEALVNMKKSDDFLWLGSALEGITVSIILLQISGVTYQLPSQVLLNILNIPKSKLHTMTSPNLSEGSTRKPSHETITSSNTHLSVQNNTGNRKSSASPRNSTNSFMSFGFSNQVNNNSDLALLSLPELVRLVASRVLYYYDMSTHDFENSVPDTVYVEFILRYIRFMISVHVGNGNFAQCIGQEWNTSYNSENDLDIEPNIFTKTEIIYEIDKVYLLNIAAMPIFDQCRIYCALASMYSDLGLIRKKALVLRMLLSSLLPKLESSTKLNQITFRDINEGKGYIRSNDDESLNSILDVIKFLFNVYLVDLETESSANAASINSRGTWVSLKIKLLKLCLKIAESTQSFEFLMNICTLLLTRYTHCLPVDDQIKVRDKIEWLIAISHTNNLNLNTPYWDPFLLRNISFISHKGKHELIPFAEYEKGTKNLDLMVPENEKISNGNGNINSYNEVFNPYNTTKNTSIDKSKLLINGDTYQLIVTLQNPFSFPIDISDLSIVTEGEVKIQTLKNTTRLLNVSNNNMASFKANNGRMNNVTISQKRAISSVAVGNQVPTSSNAPHSLTINPHSINQFIVGFIPLNSGILNISGLDIKVLNCNSQFFRIVQDELNEDFSKIKNIGISTIPNENTLEKLQKNLSENNISSRVNTSNLILSVVPSQPTLSLTGTSISNNWIMLLEGEIFPFSLSFKNNSDVTINYLSFSFWDSTIDHLSSKLNSNLPALEIYEIEWRLLKSRPFQIKNKQLISDTFKTMEPRKNLDMNLDIIGKKDMKQSKVVLEYSHKIANDTAGSYVKYLEVPINVSVVSSIEVISCEFLPLLLTSIHDTKFDDMNSCNSNIQKITDFIRNNDNIEDFCLMIIDLKNYWKEKLQCKLTNKNCIFEISEIIESGKTVRMLLPLKKISDKEIDLKKNIPSLRKKQFIKNYQISEEEEIAMKKQFWLRENILENLVATWKTCHDNEANDRIGNIDIRSLRLTYKMAETILYPNIRLSHAIIKDDTNQPIEKSGTEYFVESESFYTLKVTIKNHSNQSIQGFLRHLPVLKTGTTNVRNRTLVSLDRKILINGVLQKHIDREIKPGESYEELLSFVVLDRGHYEWVTVLDVLNQNLKVADREPVQITAL